MKSQVIEIQLIFFHQIIGYFSSKCEIMLTNLVQPGLSQQDKNLNHSGHCLQELYFTNVPSNDNLKEDL